MFKLLFSSQGRIRRLEFILSLVLLYFFMFIIGLLLGVNDDVIGSLALIMLTGLFWCWLSQAVKRSHDIGNSGWYILIPFYILLLFFIPGEKKRNKYGPDPKNPNGDDDLDEIGRHLVE